MTHFSICSGIQPFLLNKWSSAAAAAAAKSLQSCPTLCDPIDRSPSGSPILGILQARTLEWVAISFSNALKWKVKVKSLSCVRLLATPWTSAHQAPPPWNSPGKSTGVGCHCLLWNDPHMLVKCESVSCSVMSWLFATSRTVTHQVPLSMGFPRQEYG